MTKPPTEYDHDEAAAQLGVAPATLYEYRRNGLIAAEERWQGLRRKYVYTAAAIQACQDRIAERRSQR